ncbi:MAG: metalloregulator ArsR/SmtB family transcription factor [Acidobacteria bacterium]|nr:metalloregulator ArsR/SmtB family transcription factor [Acidobacteriota bacterium]
MIITMAPEPDRELNRLFAALADPTRRAILARVATGEATVTELTSPFAISMPAVSRHLNLLEAADLIVRVRDGKHRRVSLNPIALERGARWFGDYRTFWDQSFAKLDRHLETTGARGRRRRAK